MTMKGVTSIVGAVATDMGILNSAIALDGSGSKQGLTSFRAGLL